MEAEGLLTLLPFCFVRCLLCFCNCFCCFSTPCSLSFFDSNGLSSTTVERICSPRSIVSPKTRFSTLTAWSAKFLRNLSIWVLGTLSSTQFFNTTFICLSKAISSPMYTLPSCVITRSLYPTKSANLLFCFTVTFPILVYID